MACIMRRVLAHFTIFSMFCQLTTLPFENANSSSPSYTTQLSHESDRAISE